MRKELENEREKALQGLMMYRYEYEEMEQKMKKLPAPVEVVASRMPELERRIKELEADLDTEKKKPWWMKLFGNHK